MKYLYLFSLLVLIGCQSQPNLQKHIEQQEELIDSKYHLMLNDIHVKYMVNPVKYEGLLRHVDDLKHSFDIVHKELLVTDGNRDESNKLVFDYYKIVEMSLRPGYLNDEFKQCKIQINEILTKPAMGMQERKMNLLYLKTFQSMLVEQMMEEMTRDDFKFNLIRPIIVADRTKLKVGETYEARIRLVAIDTTRHPILKVEKGFVGYGPQGEGIVRYKATKKGYHTWGGVLTWPTGDGRTIDLDFQASYLVE